jgi:tripartite-type tricarboxylate transporter receptor subunit TctC
MHRQSRAARLGGKEMGLRAKGLGVLAAAICVFCFWTGEAGAQNWPERPINLLVGYGAGGGTDIIARIVAEPLGKKLGQPVIVENRPGAGGTIAARQAANAAPDGYTLYMMNNGHAVSAVVYKSLTYDPVGDFLPVSLVAKMPLVLVAGRKFEAGTLRELAALSRAKPGELNYASVTVGSSQHFAGALLKEVAGLDMTHVPFQKTPDAVTSVISGDVDVLMEVVSPVLGQIRSGDLKAIAVSSAQRYPALPDVPTVAEQGYPDFDVATWYALAAPKGTSEAIAAKVGAALTEVLAMEDVRKRALDVGFVIEGSTPDALAAHLREEIAKWDRVRKTAGIPQE